MPAKKFDRMNRSPGGSKIRTVSSKTNDGITKAKRMSAKSGDLAKKKTFLKGGKRAPRSK